MKLSLHAHPPSPSSTTLHVWPRKAKFGPIWARLTRLARLARLTLFGINWHPLAPFRPVSPRFTPFHPVSPRFSPFHPVSPRFTPFHPV